MICIYSVLGLYLLLLCNYVKNSKPIVCASSNVHLLTLHIKTPKERFSKLLNMTLSLAMHVFCIIFLFYSKFLPFYVRSVIKSSAINHLTKYVGYRLKGRSYLEELHLREERNSWISGPTCCIHSSKFQGVLL